MRDYVCPVCGAYGVTAREKLSLRLLGRATTCHRCGASLTVSVSETLVTYAILLLTLASGLLFRELWRQLLVVLAGAGAAAYWHLQIVPLVETGRHVRARH